MKNTSIIPDSSIKTTIQLTRFREKIALARRRAGYLQKDLATALGLEPHSLSHKLHGSDGALLSHKEVKQVIKTLADWDAITHHSEAVELLALMGLRPEAFSTNEWNVSPLNRLERTPPITLLIDDSFPSIPLSSRSRFQLPADLTSFIGREHLLQAVCERLQRADVRLLTLTGTGGVGKTRLALEVARQLENAFADGICFVSLAALHDPRLVSSAIAQALGLLDSPADHGHGNIDYQLQKFLREKQLLLLLDNFEHLLEANSLVSTVLERAPHIKIVVTSRAVLNLYGEHLMAVPPLEVANPKKSVGLDMLARIPAIQLFVERAQAGQSSFALTAHNVSAVAEICARLDGLPLAIELAAARIRFSSPLQLVKQLAGDRNDLSKRATRRKHYSPIQWSNLPERHQNLSQTIDWGYQLLQPEEQSMFMRLGIFADGFTEEALQSIVASSGETGYDLLMCLENLVNQSFVAQHFFTDHEKEPPRFFLLETLRDYALEQLQQSGELTHIQWRHAEYHLLLVETLGAKSVQGPHMLQATQGLKRELENIRVALAFVIEQQAAEMAFRFCCALAPFWERQSFFDEGRRWIAAALSLKEAPSPRIRAQLALIQGQMYWWEENYIQAEPLFEESRMLYQAEGEMRGLAQATYRLAETYYYQRLWTQATHTLEKSLQLYQDLEDTSGIGNTLARLGGVALFQGYLEEAERRLYESLALLRPCQQPLELYAVLGLLCAVEYLSDNLSAAFAHVQEALMLFRTVGPEAFPGHNIATLLCVCSTFLGHVGAVTIAAQLGGAAEAMFEHLGSRLASLYAPLYEEALSRNRAQVDEATWMHHWAKGRMLSLQRVISLAIDECQSTIQS